MVRRGTAEQTLCSPAVEKVLFSDTNLSRCHLIWHCTQEVARRATVQHRLLEIDYRFSDRIDSVAYLGQLSQLDQTKASTYRAWARLRTRLARIQMMVLGSGE